MSTKNGPPAARRHGPHGFAVGRGRTPAEVLSGLAAALGTQDLAPEHLLRLTLFHRGSGSERELLSDIAALLEAAGLSAGPALSLVPLPPQEASHRLTALGMAYDGPGDRLALPDPELPAPLSAAVAAGPLFVSGLLGCPGAAPGDLVGQSEAVMRRLEALAQQGGSSLSHGLKTNNFYLGAADVADWSAPARVRAAHFPEPGPAATGMPLPAFDEPALRTRVEVACLRAAGDAIPERRWVWPEGHWDWPIELPYKHGVAGAGLIFIGGQVLLSPAGEVIAANDAVAQTRGAMAAIEKILAGFEKTAERLLLLVVFHAAGTEAPVVETIRGYCAERGADPLIVEVALPALSYPGMIVEIEAVAADA